MTNSQIETFLAQKEVGKTPVTISFKTRNSIVGLFIETSDYNDLKTKNLWRIVSESKISEYKTTKNNNLARIFNGSEFTKLK
jgi:hypothetical protein